MKQKNADYELNFVVPAGPTGPEGPQGIPGPMGPTGPASLNALVFASYYASSKTGMLNIASNTLLPYNTKIFSLTSNEISINEPGNYEITVSGVLGALGKNENISISLQIENESGQVYNAMIAEISASASEYMYSQTFIYSAIQKQKVKVYLRKTDNLNSAAASTNLLIKKLSF